MVNTPRVIADFHHEDLYESLRILFEDRLGWNLYRPIGLEWFHEQYWNVWPELATAQQYLSPVSTLSEFVEKARSQDNFRPLSANPTMIEDGTYLVPSSAYDVKYRAITLDRFRELKFDYVLASMPQHIVSYQRLIKECQPQAKFIFQVGNNWDLTGYDGVVNVLSSARKARFRPNSHVVYYHQEFDWKAFQGNEHNPKHCMSMSHYQQDKELFYALEGMMPGWTYKAHGAGNRDHCRGPHCSDIRKAFREAGFLWHIKREGDGFGWNLFGAGAAGVPYVVRKHHFAGMTSEPLLRPGSTCIDLDTCRTREEIKRRLEEASGDYEQWSQRVKHYFHETVNYDNEFESIKRWIADLR